MANTYGEAGVTYGQAGGTYGGWGAAAPVAPGGKTRRPPFHHPPLPRIITVPPPEPVAPIDARYGRVEFTCSAEFTVTGTACRFGAASFTESLSPRLAVEADASLHNDDDELILLGVL